MAQCAALHVNYKSNYASVTPLCLPDASDNRHMTVIAAVGRQVRTDFVLHMKRTTLLPR